MACLTTVYRGEVLVHYLMLSALLLISGRCSLLILLWILLLLFFFFFDMDARGCPIRLGKRPTELLHGSVSFLFHSLMTVPFVNGNRCSIVLAFFIADRLLSDESI